MSDGNDIQEAATEVLDQDTPASGAPDEAELLRAENGQLKARLADSYPHDQATGYSKGQIRGALTVKRPL